MKNPLFGGSKRGFFGVRKGGFLRRGGGAADFSAKLCWVTAVTRLGYGRGAAKILSGRGWRTPSLRLAHRTRGGKTAAGVGQNGADLQE